MSLLKGIDRMRDMLLEKRNVLRAGFRPTTRCCGGARHGQIVAGQALHATVNATHARCKGGDGQLKLNSLCLNTRSLSRLGMPIERRVRGCLFRFFLRLLGPLDLLGGRRPTVTQDVPRPLQAPQETGPEIFASHCDAKISGPVSCGACSGRGTSWVTVGLGPPRRRRCRASGEKIETNNL